jgi:hypothetical protein
VSPAPEVIALRFALLAALVVITALTHELNVQRRPVHVHVAHAGAR